MIITDALLKQCSTLAAKIMADDRFGAQSGFTCGVEVTQTNLFDKQEVVRYVCKTRTRTVTPGAFVRLRCVVLDKMRQLPADTLDQTVLEEIASRSGYRPDDVPIEALLLNEYARMVVTLTAPTAIMTLLSTPDADDHMRTVFGDDIVVMRHKTTFLALVMDIRLAAGDPLMKPIAIPGIGLLTSGSDANDAYNALNTITRQAEVYVNKRFLPSDATQPNRRTPSISKIVRTRAELSRSVAQPVIAVTGDMFDDKTMKSVEAIAVTASDVQYTRLSSGASAVVVDPAFGVLCAGESVAEAEITQNIARRHFAIRQGAAEISQYINPLPDNVAIPQEAMPRSQFTGEVVLITGAASGIGEATAAVFLERGAAVVGFDIDPAICEMWQDTPGFLGVNRDVTAIDDVRTGIAEAVLRFGGIDMVFLNAGVNEDQANLDSFDSELWDHVMNTNLSANAMLLRELYPVLKLAPKYGRVVFNASKSAVAPGPGSSSYTVSKMGLIQLARLTALEWAGDGIRCYVVNPNAVFDTNMWQDNLAEKRAAHYGMTVEEYRRNNLLNVEIKSRDVGELVADLCGEHFAKTTGLQLPIDGGNARVI